jgi:hypothetical protein
MEDKGLVETTPEHVAHGVAVAVFRLRGGAAEERSEVAPDSASKLDGERRSRMMTQALHRRGWRWLRLAASTSEAGGDWATSTTAERSARWSGQLTSSE